MMLIDATNMPNFCRFLKGDVRTCDPVFMVEGFDSETEDRSVINVRKHEERALETPTGTYATFLMHEPGLKAGRDAYSIREKGQSAVDLYSQPYAIFKRVNPTSLVGYYNRWNPYDLAALDVSLFSNFEDDCCDYFAPSAYVKNISLKEFAARIKFIVTWLKARSDKPVYLCAWHMTEQKGQPRRYMNVFEMDAYLMALQESGADGVIWWAGWSEGIRGDNITNNFLYYEYWNDRKRYGHVESAWAESFLNVRWGEAA